jgi:hypothetical protein
VAAIGALLGVVPFDADISVEVDCGHALHKSPIRLAGVGGHDNVPAPGQTAAVGMLID